jgi:peptidoglycan/xylan/chitin deacetylase (PgdA/CDA1 family)
MMGARGDRVANPPLAELDYTCRAQSIMLNASIKERLVRMAGRSLRTVPLAWATRGYFSRRANIIFYHGVWEHGSRRRQLFTGMHLDAFAAQLKTLAGFFDFVNIERILADGHAGAARPRLHLTFDDGFDLVTSGAVDVLDSLGIAATVFVNTACLSNAHLLWQHSSSAIQSTRGNAVFVKELNALQARTGQAVRIDSADRQIEAMRFWPADRKDEYAALLWEACDMPPVAEFLEEHKPYMDWAALRNWLRRGHAVGFHTHSHPFCSRLSDDQIETEILTPVQQLNEQLRQDSVPFAYPFGDRLPPEKEARVKASGSFSCLLGTGGFSRRGTSPFELERVEAKSSIDAEIFGRPIIRAIRQRGIIGPRSGGAPESPQYLR